MPRLSVFRSLNHIYAQIVDDARGQTLVSASTRDKEVRTTLKTGGNVAAAKVVGQALAKRAGAAGISRVVFDRGGYAYHGRVKALADAARSGIEVLGCGAGVSPAVARAFLRSAQDRLCP